MAFEYTMEIYPHFRVDGTEYTEDDLHRPGFAADVNPAEHILTSVGENGMMTKEHPIFSGTVVPQRGKEFSEVIIATEDFSAGSFAPGFTQPVFAVLENFSDDPERPPVYCWIDSIEFMAYKSAASSYRVRFHIDWYLTMCSMAYAAHMGHTDHIWAYGQGRVLKASAGHARPSAVEARTWVYKRHFVHIGKTLSDSDLSGFPVSDWAIMTRIIHVETRTQIEYDYWPLEKNLPGVNRSPKLDEILRGQLDEMVGGAPEDILGCWISPIPPYTKIRSSFSNFSGSGECGYAYANNPSYGIFLSKNVLDYEMRTDDRQKAVFVDCSRTPIFTAPWGINFSEVDAWVDLGTSAAYLNIYLNPTPGTIWHGKDQEGRLFSTPLPALPITGNAWSSYVYSGQREYDIKSREIQRKENAVNGISGMTTSAIGGAIAGSMVAPGLGTLAGLIGGTAASGMSTAASFLTGGKFDGREQRAVDRLKSNQSAGMILASGGGASINHPLSSAALPEWVGITMQRDPVSLAELDTAQAELGYDTDFYAPDCSDLIAQGGPLQISGLQVRGDMPAEGKQYISTLFARGVNIDIIG